MIAIAELGVRMFETTRAGRYHDDLFAVLDLIAASPRMARDRKEISPPVRIHPFKARLIVYRIDEGRTIFLIRIGHGHADWVCGSV
ncbi:type II toxin-antitoxin system RelE/ParE family toxin [Rhizobium sp. BR 314]